MRPIKGLHTDFRPISQPPETTRFVLNGIEDGFDGNLGSVSTEPGNEFCFTTGVEAIGTVTLANDEVVIFSVGDSYSEIGVARECNYEALVRSNCLNFSKEYPIKGVYRVKDCDRIVYFYDGHNPDRFINLDQLEEFLLDGFSIGSTSVDKWDCDKFNLNFSFETVSVDSHKVLEFGSQLEEGSYAFAFAYEDSEGNQTDFFSFTDTIAIDTGNSIELTLSNVDTSYDFIVPAVVSFTTGDGVTTAVYKLPKVSISSDTLIYLFNNVSSGVITDLGDINIPGSQFVSSRAMDIVNNRLVRANLRERDIEWDEFQRAALNTQVRWVAKAEEIEFTAAQLQIEQKSLRRDEIYSIGIVFVFKSGTESPVFPIPGRETDTATQLVLGNNTPHWRSQTAGPWDTAEQTVVATPAVNIVTVPNLDEVYNQDVVHLNVGVGDTLPRWKVWNTAIRDEDINNTRGYWAYAGLMGHFESTELYPDTKDCNGLPVFGDLAGTPVRYHRMPDLTIAPIHRNFFEGYLPIELIERDWIFHLGLELDNIQIPAQYADQVEGYRIVYSRIDNPTVIDTGIMEFGELNFNTSGDVFLSQPVPFHESQYDGNNHDNSPGEIYTFHSPDAKMNAGIPSTTYTVTQTRLRGEIDELYNGAAPTTPDFGERRYYTVLKGFSIFTVPSQRTVFGQGRVGINTITNVEGFPFINAGGQEVDWFGIDFIHYYIASITYNTTNIADETNIDYPLTSLKRVTSVFPSMASITYVQFDGKLLTGTDATIYGGDTYLTDFTFRKTQREVTTDESTIQEDIEWYDTTAAIRFVAESTRNANLRQEADSAIFIASDGTQQQGDVFFPGTLGLDTFLKREPEFRNYYFTSLDHDVSNFYKEHRTLSYNYEYCDGCNEYPNLLAYSEESSDIDRFDNFRKFRVNNLATIPGSRGEITNVIYYRKNLLVFTKESLFQLVPNPQQVISDTGAIYLGTAEFLSIPSNEIVQAEHGHAGSSGRFNLKSTPYGLFYVDIEQGKIYKFYDGLEDVSAIGMHNFFQEHRDYELNKQYISTFGFEYPLLDNTIIDNGVGTISVYDPRYERVIITKKDLQSQVPVNELQVCFNYPINAEGDSVTFTDFQSSSANPFVFDENISTNHPPGVYDMVVEGMLGFQPEDNDLTYTRFYPYYVNYLPLAGASTGIIYASSTLEVEGTTVSATNAGEWLSGAIGTGGPGFKPANSWDDLPVTNPANGGQAGIYFTSNILGPMLYAPQVDPSTWTRMRTVLTTNAVLTDSPDNFPLYGLYTPGLTERTVMDPSTGKVVELGITRNESISFSPVTYTLSYIHQTSQQVFLGMVVPETDVWDFSYNFTILMDSGEDPPIIQLVVDEATTYDFNVNLAQQTAFYDGYSVELTINNFSLSKDQTLDVFMNNNKDGEGFIPTSGEMLLKSTTNIERQRCEYTTAEEIFNLGVYDGLSIVGYPEGATSAALKNGFTDEPPYQFAEAYTSPSQTYTAAGSPYVLPGGSPAVDGGIYEILEEQSPLEFLDVALGAANYTITVYNDETNDQVGSFVYNTGLSTANGYDTFLFEPSGSFSYIRKTDNSQILRTELTVVSDTTSEIEHDEGFKWYKVINATADIVNPSCSDFIIKEHDSLVGTIGSVFSLDVGTVPRLINYVTVETDGQYDIHFENDLDITDTAFTWTIQINGTVYTGLQGSIVDPNKLFVTLKDVDLLAGDEIMLLVSNVNSSPDSTAGEWLTTLVKKDYVCVEVLPKTNESHTVSYDVKNNHWTSFHSYLPKLYYNDSQSYYSTEDLSNFYKHGDRNYNTYYGTKYPHVVEFVVNEVNTTILNSVQWVGKVESYDETNKQWVEVDDTTYNKFMIYNSKQSTGIQELDFEQSPIEWSNVVKRVIKSDYNYRTAGIRNVATNLPVNTSDWDEIETTFNQYGYIDKIPLSTSVDYNITMADLSPLRDKYHVVRLIYDGDQLYRISLDVTGTQQQYSLQ